MSLARKFKPGHPIISGSADPECVASVILPARNEEDSIGASLDALARQTDSEGRPLDSRSYEVLLLLNNCTDCSAKVAEKWKELHPEMALHVAELVLPTEVAHVGTARQLLMDTAWRRLRGRADRIRGILSTDADTVVADNWIAQNMLALGRGADAVGGEIRLKPGNLATLPRGARRAYLRDRRYQRLVAELESIVSPQPGDPWPRHLEHFGASLACTPEIYAQAGGMPAVSPLEDVAFVQALRAVGARVRHEPSVYVFTSARFDGRAEIGLSHQLRTWHQMSEGGEEHLVPSAAWLMHKFQTLGKLRAQRVWSPEVEAQAERNLEESFCGRRDAPILRVNKNLAAALKRLRPSHHLSTLKDDFIDKPMTMPDVLKHLTDSHHAAPA